MFGIKFILTIFLLIGVFFPKTAWKMSESWKFKHAEPSDAYLIVTRVTSATTIFLVWFML